MALVQRQRPSFSYQFQILLLACLLFPLMACSSSTAPSQQTEQEEEAESRTEFTARVENFFEYEPLKAGKPSQFLIHLTDLSDGSPVEKAEVTLLVRPKNRETEVARATARVGKVTGIYVADLNIAKVGEYDIEFLIKSAKLDERMPLTDFKVE
jgi:hypothetical protein